MAMLEAMPATETSAEAALDRAVHRLLSLQDDRGWWQGELETNVTMDAEDLMMRQFLGVRTDEQTARSARWIRSRQRDDGSWANFYGGPPDLSTTVEAYVALKLAGDDPDAPHLRRARQVVLRLGGLENSRVFTRMWLALFGEWDWADIPVLPSELVFAPERMPLNLYDFACWARQTIAPLTIISALRPRRELGCTVAELRSDRPGGRLRRGRAATRWGRGFERMDALLHQYERLPRKPLRGTAIRRMAEWIVARQEADGSWGGIQPPWVYSLMALNALGYAVDHPVIAAGLDGWERFTILEDTPDGPSRRIEACQSPVWDTALSMIALSDAGTDPTHPALERAADWLCQEEIRVPGDWAVQRPDLAPSGWAFEFDNDLYPDVDDTAEVIIALLRTRPTPERLAAIDRGTRWATGMQCADGGYAAFDADNTRELAYEIPFSDFGAMIDPPSADVTGHMVEMLADGGDRQARDRAVRWLLDDQRPDGSWFGRWGANHVYGTGAVVPALVAAGVPAGDPVIRRAVAWLEAYQNDDGGWGEDMRSYDEPEWIGQGDSTASQTAWALLALHAAGECGSPAARRGIAWLVANQNEDGSWDEPQFTGTGFPGDFYINYHLYRLVFPISALGRCLGRNP